MFTYDNNYFCPACATELTNEEYCPTCNNRIKYNEYKAFLYDYYNNIVILYNDSISFKENAIKTLDDLSEDMNNQAGIYKLKQNPPELNNLKMQLSSVKNEIINFKNTITDVINNEDILSDSKLIKEVKTDFKTTINDAIDVSDKLFDLIVNYESILNNNQELKDDIEVEEFHKNLDIVFNQFQHVTDEINKIFKDEQLRSQLFVDHENRKIYENQVIENKQSIQSLKEELINNLNNADKIDYISNDKYGNVEDKINNMIIKLDENEDNLDKILNFIDSINKKPTKKSQVNESRIIDY